MNLFETTVQEVLRKSVLQLKVDPRPYSPPFECVDLCVEQLFADEGLKLKERAMRRYGWSPDFVQRVYEEYKKFLTLRAAARDWRGDLLSPPATVDALWRLHVVETHRYAEACLGAFGHVIEHDPDADLEPERLLVRRFAAVAAVRARFADGFDAQIWTLSGEEPTVREEPVRRWSLCDEPAPPRAGPPIKRRKTLDDLPDHVTFLFESTHVHDTHRPTSPVMC